MKYHFKVTKEKTGFWAVCVELQGCSTQGDTREELLKNMKEALNLYLDEPADSKIVFPLPKKKGLDPNLVEVPVEPRIAFAFALRRLRLKHKLTQKEIAQKIGITGSLNNYQRLENSDTANPVLETIVQIKKAFPDFPLEEIAS